MSEIVIVKRKAEASNAYSFTFPVSESTSYLLNWAHIDYTSDATVGNRQMRMYVTDGSDAMVEDAHAGAVQAASLEREYNFVRGIFRETSFIDTEIEVPLPANLYIPGGFKLKFFDNTNVSASDSMVVSFQYQKTNLSMSVE